MNKGTQGNTQEGIGQSKKVKLSEAMILALHLAFAWKNTGIDCDYIEAGIIHNELRSQTGKALVRRGLFEMTAEFPPYYTRFRITPAGIQWLQDNDGQGGGGTATITNPATDEARNLEPASNAIPAQVVITPRQSLSDEMWAGGKAVVEEHEQKYEDAERLYHLASELRNRFPHKSFWWDRFERFAQKAKLDMRRFGGDIFLPFATGDICPDCGGDARIEGRQLDVDRFEMISCDTCHGEGTLNDITIQIIEDALDIKAVS